MLRRLLIRLYRRPLSAGALRKVDSVTSFSTAATSSPPPPKRHSLGLYFAAPALAVTTGYAAYSWSGDAEFKFEHRDLVSNAALWALYERWCRHHAIHRTPEDMQRRFVMFKWHALHAYDINHRNLGYELALNRFSDETLEEARNGCTFSFPNWAEDIEKLQEESKEAPGDACAICRQGFSESHPSVVIGCKHEFHPLCIFKWRFISCKCRVCWQPISLKDPTSEGFDKRDLEKDKVLWALYERWCHSQGLNIAPEDMQKRFNKLNKWLGSSATAFHRAGAAEARARAVKFMKEVQEEQKRNPRKSINSGA